MRIETGRMIVVALALALPAVAAAQAPDDQARLAAQRAAMARLAWMDGRWRGEAVTQLPSGPHRVTQTERIGPFLGGTIKLLEGRGFDRGKVAFNAFGTVSFDPATGKYTLHSYAQGRSGDFPLTPTADGYVWEIPAGPMTIRYTATVTKGAWREIGERVIPGKPPVQFFEMNLRRLGDSDWPEAGAMKPQ